MTFPTYRLSTGEDYSLNWERLRPEEEVGMPAPASAPVQAQAFGFQEVTEAGAVFLLGSRESAQLVTVSPDISVVGMGFDQTRKAKVPRGVWGPRTPVELDRPWRSGDALKARETAVAILEAHNYPRDYMHRAIAWAWVGKDLHWAEVPDRAGRVVLPRPRMNGTMEPTAVPITTSYFIAQEGPRYSAAWPAFGALAWAKRIYGASESMTYVEDQLASHGEHVAELAAVLWHAAFGLGAHLAEHRLRALHGKMLEKGQYSYAATSAGADRTNALRALKAKEGRDHAVELADTILAAPLHAKRKRGWTLDALAQEVFALWKLDESPSLSTVRRYLKEAAKAGDLPSLA